MPEISSQFCASTTILVTFFALPINITAVGYLPFMTGISERIKLYLTWPSLLGTCDVRPLPYNLGNVPTIEQSLYIVAFVIVSVIMTATDYRVAIPHAWYGDEKCYAIMPYVMWRTGAFALIYLTLVILFSGRNNVLLWLSNWSHSTCMLLNRWIARIFAVHVILHSILALVLYVRTGASFQISSRYTRQPPIFFFLNPTRSIRFRIGRSISKV